MKFSDLSGNSTVVSIGKKKLVFDMLDLSQNAYREKYPKQNSHGTCKKW